MDGTGKFNFHRLELEQVEQVTSDKENGDDGRFEKQYERSA